MAKGKTVTRLVDRLQAEIDSYVQTHEAMVTDYRDLLAENEVLRDKLAEVMKAKR
jgi:cell shape-determining protein MreC